MFDLETRQESEVSRGGLRIKYPRKMDKNTNLLSFPISK